MGFSFSPAAHAHAHIVPPVFAAFKCKQDLCERHCNLTDNLLKTMVYSATDNLGDAPSWLPGTPNFLLRNATLVTHS